MNVADLVAVSRGDVPADIILQNARIVNTFTGSIDDGNIAIYKDRIAGIGDYSKANQIIDLKRSYLAPGLINGHTHIESSMLHPVQYARVVVPRGTTSVVTDLHEITNVAGLEGFRFVTKWARRLPLDMLFMVPSCVPTTHMETNGADIGPLEIKKLLKWRNVIGLGEMMNFSGVIYGDEQVMQKLAAAHYRTIDGHAPTVHGKWLNAYLAAGVHSDHESLTLEEGREKLQLGMYLMIREGSAEKNLETLLPLVNEKTSRRCLFVVDDRSCSDLLRQGDIDAVVRKAILAGLDPVMAIQMATINAAEYFRLYDLGGLAPGYKANLIVFNDLSKLDIHTVFHHGQLVAREGNPQFHAPDDLDRELTDTFKIRPFTIDALKLVAKDEYFPVIDIIPGQIITRKLMEQPGEKDGIILADTARDILKLAVVERHRATGNIGLGLVKGFGLKRGAIASSIAHDSHNIVAAGTNDTDLFIAIQEIERLHGGLTVCCDGKIIASLPLPIAGLLSPQPLPTVVDSFEKVEKAAAGLGNVPPAPFALLSFLALPVIPELRLTDKGIVDVLKFKLLER